MSKVIAIARREIQERAFMFVAALALACAPFLGLLVPRETLSSRMQVVGSVSMVIAIGAVLGFSLLLGASVVGRELTEKRLSFYFARPVSGTTIWFGKLAAALAIIVGCELIAFVPAWMIFRSTVNEPRLLQPVGLTLLLAVTVFALAHAASTVLRSRSPLVVADFGAAIAFIAIIGALLVPLLEHGAYALLAIVVSAVGVVVLAVMLVAPAWQLQRGRTDARRNHRELSRFVWMAAAILIAVLAAYTVWVRRVVPSDLKVTSAEYPFGHQDAAGVAVGGIVRHRFDYRAAFVIDAETGDYRPVPIEYTWSAVSNGTGSAVIWTEGDVALLDALPAVFRTTHTVFPQWRLNVAKKADHWRAHEIAAGTGRNGRPTSLGISDDGKTAVTVDGTTATVYDVPSGRIRMAARIPVQQPAWTTARFLSPDTVRLFVNDFRTHTALVMDIDIVARRTRVTATIRDAAGNSLLVMPVAHGQRFLARTIGRAIPARITDLRLCDASTGRQIGVFADPEKPASVRGLRDGRLVGFVEAKSGSELRVYDPDARLLRTINLGGAKNVSIGPQLPNGLLIVSTSSGRYSRPEEWTSHAVDVDRGVIVASASGLLALRHMWFDAPPRIPVFMDGRGELVTWDPGANARRVLVALGR